jgi:rhodanese-related sulfurtransferase
MEATAARVAAEYLQKGYTNIRVLGGSVEAWRKAGYPVFSTG